VFLNGLDFEFEFCQVGFQLRDLLRLGLETALKMMSASTLAVTPTTIAAVTGVILAITSFIVTHFIFSFQFS
jgi:hypothetical protein